MRIIDADTVAVDPLGLVEALRTAHRGALGDVGRLLVETDGDGALSGAGFRRDLGLAVKTATVFRSNAARGRPIMIIR